ncbi:hypothetical protein S1OALGB6SA_685 [Olavius algarvensis spirochete endosymbiont]|nr:MAG: hypothetical protein [Olavius algarvensis spirochete endosymbiont]VDA99614.1 hypothetical protein S1OALGB6SA_685 [Olavius algarvensis spirochete endosymbiont]
MKEIRTLAILALTLATLSCQSAKRDFESVGKLSMRNLKHKDDLSVSHQEAKEELEILVLRINSDISNGRYEKWLSYLKQ